MCRTEDKRLIDEDGYLRSKKNKKIDFEPPYLGIKTIKITVTGRVFNFGIQCRWSPRHRPINYIPLV